LRKKDNDSATARRRAILAEEMGKPEPEPETAGSAGKGDSGKVGRSNW
jgi:hypothetical protein